MSDLISQAPNGEILLFQSADGTARVECRFESDTLWLTQVLIADLYQKGVPTINEHLSNIFSEGEVDRNSTIRKFRIVRQEGTRQVEREIEHYNLEAILAVGYRVRSPQGTQFRQWATQTLQQYLVKGFAMDDERLKNPDNSVYFEQLLARIRDIRSSEKVFWRKICDIYATSLDYDGKAETSQQFFAQVQNKMHWATHGHTAAELIHLRADAQKPSVGLTHFTGDEPRKADMTVAKNYLSEKELSELNRLVTSYLEFAELQAERGRLMKMADWSRKLDDFLRLSDYELLNHAGSISAIQAKQKAALEYDKFQRVVDAKSSQVDKDFEQAIKRLPKK
ncbi:MAG: virulence RhuM family protein [Proteobacteria bacterium]|nr:virulence RhuM family protein [Pseudomonadota bacterium]